MSASRLFYTLLTIAMSMILVLDIQEGNTIEIVIDCVFLLLNTLGITLKSQGEK